MMFMMGLNVDSNQATKSLGVVAMSCRRAFSPGGALLYETVVNTAELGTMSHAHTHKRKKQVVI